MLCSIKYVVLGAVFICLPALAMQQSTNEQANIATAPTSPSLRPTDQGAGITAHPGPSQPELDDQLHELVRRYLIIIMGEQLYQVAEPTLRDAFGFNYLEPKDTSAMINGGPQCIQQLLDAGANPTALIRQTQKFQYGRSALGLALECHTVLSSTWGNRRKRNQIAKLINLLCSHHNAILSTDEFATLTAITHPAIRSLSSACMDLDSTNPFSMINDNPLLHRAKRRVMIVSAIATGVIATNLYQLTNLSSFFPTIGIAALCGVIVPPLTGAIFDNLKKWNAHRKIKAATATILQNNLHQTARPIIDALLDSPHFRCLRNDRIGYDEGASLAASQLGIPRR